MDGCTPSKTPQGARERTYAILSFSLPSCIVMRAWSNPSFGGAKQEKFCRRCLCEGSGATQERFPKWRQYLQFTIHKGRVRGFGRNASDRAAEQREGKALCEGCFWGNYGARGAEGPSNLLIAAVILFGQDLVSISFVYKNNKEMRGIARAETARFFG